MFGDDLLVYAAFMTASALWWFSFYVTLLTLSVSFTHPQLTIECLHVFAPDCRILGLSKPVQPLTRHGIWITWIFGSNSDLTWRFKASVCIWLGDLQLIFVSHSKARIVTASKDKTCLLHDWASDSLLQLWMQHSKLYLHNRCTRSVRGSPRLHSQQHSSLSLHAWNTSWTDQSFPLPMQKTTSAIDTVQNCSVQSQHTEPKSRDIFETVSIWPWTLPVMLLINAKSRPLIILSGKVLKCDVQIVGLLSRW